MADQEEPRIMSRRILLVEDDPLLLESLASLLDEEGYQVVAAPDAHKALEEAAKCRFDLVVTDVRMPGLSGMNMLRRLRDSSPEMRSVVITGFADFEAPVEAFRLKVDDFLTKPFDEATFLASVRRALEWLDRQAHWHRCLDQTYRDGLSLLDWVSSPSPRVQRRAELARRLAEELGMTGQEHETAALLRGVASTEERRQGTELFQKVLAEDPSLRLGWEKLSLASLMKDSLEVSLGSDLLELVDRYEALAHPDDAAIGLSRQECLQRLRLDWDGPAEMLSKLEQVLTGQSDEPDEPDPSARALLGLGLGYLYGGRADLAIEALERLPNHTEALLALAQARAACGQAEAGLAAAEQALAKSRGLLQRADALSLVGSLKLLTGKSEGRQDLEQAAQTYLGCGAKRGELKTRLLEAWAYALAGKIQELDRALAELLKRAEETGLQWVLLRERWLSLTVFEAGAETSQKEQVAPWLSRLGGHAQTGKPEADLLVEGLGPLRLRAHGREVPDKAWKTSKSRDLFIILLLHRGTEVPDERLTDLFWEELEGDRAQGNLYSALTYIRRAIRGKEKKGPDPVQHRRGRCKFNLDLSHQIDFLEFEDLAVKGMAARDEGDSKSAVSLLEQAVALYGGDLLENLETPWVLPYRRRYRDLAVQACEFLLSHYEAEKDQEKTMSAGERLLSVDKCHQGAYQSLMRAWAEAGQPERVARLYWTCQQALQDELYMAPSSETTRLYTQLTEGVLVQE